MSTVFCGQSLVSTESATSGESPTSQYLSALPGRLGRGKFVLDGLGWKDKNQRTSDGRIRTSAQNGAANLRACWQLTATCARPSDARIATAASLFIGVLFCCAPRLQISRTPPDPRWIRRRRDHDHATTCSRAARHPRQEFRQVRDRRPALHCCAPLLLLVPSHLVHSGGTPWGPRA